MPTEEEKIADALLVAARDLYNRARFGADGVSSRALRQLDRFGYTAVNSGDYARLGKALQAYTDLKR